MNITQMQAVADLTTQRADLLAQVETAARASQLALQKWQALAVAVAAPTLDEEDNIIEPGGSIGSRWPEAQAANEDLIVALGGAMPQTLSALQAVIVATRALQQAGEGLGLDLLPGLTK